MSLRLTLRRAPRGNGVLVGVPKTPFPAVSKKSQEIQARKQRDLSVPYITVIRTVDCGVNGEHVSQAE